MEASSDNGILLAVIGLIKDAAEGQPLLALFLALAAVGAFVVVFYGGKELVKYVAEKWHHNSAHEQLRRCCEEVKAAGEAVVRLQKDLDLKRQEIDHLRDTIDRLRQRAESAMSNYLDLKMKYAESQEEIHILRVAQRP